MIRLPDTHLLGSSDGSGASSARLSSGVQRGARVGGRAPSPPLEGGRVSRSGTPRKGLPVAALASEKHFVTSAPFLRRIRG